MRRLDKDQLFEIIEVERWLGLFAQGSATDKWIVCRLLP